MRDPAEERYAHFYKLEQEYDLERKDRCPHVSNQHLTEGVVSCNPFVERDNEDSIIASMSGSSQHNPPEERNYEDIPEERDYENPPEGTSDIYDLGANIEKDRVIKFLEAIARVLGHRLGVYVRNFHIERGNGVSCITSDVKHYRGFTAIEKEDENVRRLLENPSEKIEEILDS